MKLTEMMLAGALLATVPSMTLAQQAATGTISMIDRISGNIVIRQTQSGTVGASDGGATEQQYKAAAGLLDTVHVGDRISFSVSESGGNKTVTKIDRQ